MFDSFRTAQLNVEAIRVVKNYQFGGKLTDEDRQILSLWKGWGGCSSAFNANKSSSPGWGKIQEDLLHLLDDKERSAAMDSTINAHFTNKPLIKSIYKIVNALLPNGGTALEIGCGSGNFIGESDSKWTFTGIELEPISAKIAELLYPNATIINESISTAEIEDSSFDLVIGNVPFASYSPYDPIYNPLGAPLHDYCLMRGIHALKDGGVMAVITSKFTLDKKNSQYREWFAQHANLLYAYRLPSSTHSNEAGTSAVTDLLIFQKKSSIQPKRMLSPDKWINTFQTEINKYSSKLYVSSDPYSVTCNQIFRNIDSSYNALLAKAVSYNWSPTRGLTNELKFVLPTSTNRTSPKGPGEEINPWSYLHARKSENAAIFGQPYAGGMYAGDDMEVRSDYRGLDPYLAFLDSVAIYASPLPDPQVGNPIVSKKSKTFTPPKLDIPTSNQYEYDFLNELKAAVKCVLSHQEITDTLWQATTDNLSDVYCRYVNKFGKISRKRNNLDKKTWGLFQHDPEWTYVGSLEHYDENTDEIVLSKIFTERILSTISPSPKTIDDAISASILFKNKIDIEYIKSLLGSSNDEELLESIEEHAFLNPATKEYEPNNIYLSGDVVSKLAIAVSASKKDDKFNRNVEALESVQPKPLGPGEFDISLGVHWINQTYVNDFLSSLCDGRDTYLANLEVTGTWTVTKDSYGPPPVRYEGLGKSFQSIISDILNGRQSKVYIEVDTENGVKKKLDVERTAILRDSITEIKELFTDWVLADPKITQQLCNIYNSKYNRTVVTEWNGDYLSNINGMSSEFSLRPHQRNCIDRILRSGNTLIAHPVGAGKTAVMATVAIKGKELGLFNKPLIVVPNLAVENFSVEFRRMFPLAKILTYGQTTEKIGRQEFIGMSSLHDWDAIIMPLSVFERIPLSIESQENYVESKIAHLRGFESEEKNAESGSYSGPSAASKATVKKIVAKIKSLENKYKKGMDSEKDQTPLTFEDLGIDCLFVDEIQEWKNLPVISNLDTINGNGSKRSVDLESKIAWLRDRSKSGLYICGATGTHVSNAVWELWVVWNYINRESLIKYGFDNFDAWMKQFSEVTSSMEVKADGATWELKTRISGYSGVKTLMRLVSEWADLLNESDLNLETPSIVGGEPLNYTIEPTEELNAFTESLTERMNDISAGLVDRRDDNMLAICGDGRKAALDLRLVDIFQEEDKSKSANLAHKVNEIFIKTKDNKYLSSSGKEEPIPGSLQLIFCDLGTPSKEWNVYDEMKKKILEFGNIPEDKIRYIHEFNTPAKKRKMLDLANSGKISVLIGSTAKMGTALNIQTRVSAVHHVDPPWRPSDIKQRDGRGIRQGNQNEQIAIIRYLTKNSFDIFYWQTLERKKKFTEQVSTANPTLDRIEEIAMDVLTFTQAKALATGNQTLIELAEVEANLKLLENKKRRFISHRSRMQKELESNEYELKFLEVEIPRLQNYANLASQSQELMPIEAADTTYLNNKIIETVRAGEIYSAPAYRGIGLEDDSQIFGIFEIALSKNYSSKYGNGDLSAALIIPSHLDLTDFGINLPREHFTRFLKSKTITFMASSISDSKIFTRLVNSLNSVHKDLESRLSRQQYLKDSSSAIEKQLLIPFSDESQLAKATNRYIELKEILSTQQSAAA